MKKTIFLILIVTAFWLMLATPCALALKEDKCGYLIISNHCCIIVRSPVKQLTASIGRANLEVILKDRSTQIAITGGYLAIAVPLNKIAATIRKYHLQNLTMIE